jgi:homoserine kinase
MRKVKITLPAALTNLGAGVGALGLALSLHTVIEVSQRTDSQLIVDAEGEGSGRYSIGLRHPVVLAMMRVFQKLERAPIGVNIRITNQIPVNSGLGAEAAFLVAGVIGAHNLLGSTFARAEILQAAAQISHGQTSGVVTTLMGGLTAGVLDGDTLIYRAIPIQGFKVIVVVPDIEGYAEKARAAVPERVTLADAIHNLSRVPLLTEGLRAGDLKLVGRVLDDKLLTPALSTRIPGYPHVVEIARRAGASAVTISGDGPALVAFAERDHERISEVMVAAFANADVQARAWVLPVDTQGIVISAVQSA